MSQQGPETKLTEAELRARLQADAMHRHGFTLRDGKAALSPARSQSTALRILPVVIVALVALLSFKTIGLVRDGGYAFPFGASGSEHPFDNFGRLVAGWRAAPPTADPIVTGTVPDDKKEKEPEAAKAEDKSGEKVADAAAKAAPDAAAAAEANQPDRSPLAGAPAEATPIPAQPLSETERALMLRLQTRREALDKLQKEIELREGLLAAAEKRLEDRIKDLRGAEDDEGIDPANPGSSKKQRQVAEQMKNVVSMYETMRPKEAARSSKHLRNPCWSRLPAP